MRKYYFDMLYLACVLFISCSKGTKLKIKMKKQTPVPLRIVSLSPAATEILLCLSRSIAARTDGVIIPRGGENFFSWWV